MNLFSRRNETRRPDEGLVYDDIPERLEAGFYNVMTRVTNLDPYERGATLVNELAHALDFEAVSNLSLYDIVVEAEWDEICDMYEAVWGLLPERMRDPYTNELNALLPGATSATNCAMGVSNE